MRGPWKAAWVTEDAYRSNVTWRRSQMIGHHRAACDVLQNPGALDAWRHSFAPSTLLQRAYELPSTAE